MVYNFVNILILSINKSVIYFIMLFIDYYQSSFLKRQCLGFPEFPVIIVFYTHFCRVLIVLNS